MTDNHNDLLFIPADGLVIEDLYDWKIPQNANKVTRLSVRTGERKKLVRRSSSTPTGAVIECNKTSIAVFRHGNDVFALPEHCPHAGGPLHLGDIEDVPLQGLCVRCPWHSWKYSLNTGKVVSPKGHSEIQLKLFPVNVKDDGQILIGFDRFSPEYFICDDF